MAAAWIVVVAGLSVVARGTAAPTRLQTATTSDASDASDASDEWTPRTPPLAWSSWNYFANNVNESVVLGIADAMVTLGLRELGYQYINIDAGYLLHNRSASGELQVNPDKFPRGMAAVASDLHAKNLSLGVYTDLTDRSCGIGPGSFGHYQQDADTFASWGVDYLKVDYCGSAVSRDPAPQYAAWMAFGQALKNTTRNIYYSICPHGKIPEVGTGAAYKGSSGYAPPLVWTDEQRHAVSNSILVEYFNNFDAWYSDTTYGRHVPSGMITNIDSSVLMWNYSTSQPGTFGDFDMLQMCTYGKGGTVGAGMTLEEYRSHYSVWVVLGSPLIHSADMRTIARDHPGCLALMLNAEVLAVNQDPAVLPAQLVFQATNSSTVSSASIVEQVFARPLHDGSVAVVLFNRDEQPREMQVVFDDVGLGAVAVVRDLWKQTDVGTVHTAYSATVESHGVVFVKLTAA